VRPPRRATTSALAGVAALIAAAPTASGIDQRIQAARSTISLPRTSEGMQARYDAGRDLEIAVGVSGYALPRCKATAALSLGRGLVRQAEGFDRPLLRLEGAGRRQSATAVQELLRCRTHDTQSFALQRPPSPPRLRLPRLVAARPEGARDSATVTRLARLGRAFPGWAGIWVHDLVTGRTAGWNADAKFPAASTVKLGVLLATLQRLRHPERSPLDYDLRSMMRWSSNLAANRLLGKIGGPNAVERALRRAGARRSTYPQGYRVGTALRPLDVKRQPPVVSGRVTTAHDLGRILYLLHAGALRDRTALRTNGLDRVRSRYALGLLLASEARGNNVGLLRPWLERGTRIAQKNGWLHDARHTAAVVYFRRGPKIVVVLTYARGLRLSSARDLGAGVLTAIR
jgi:beta-lactamase class A